MGNAGDNTGSKPGLSAEMKAGNVRMRRHSLLHRGFTLLELMIVISVIMILAAIAIPSYHRHIIQTKEAVLRSNIKTLDGLIQQYTLDKRQAPQSLEDLKTASYLKDIPVDPMTGAADWDTEQEDFQAAADPNQPGITAVHSHSSGTSLDGQAYSSW